MGVCSYCDRFLSGYTVFAQVGVKREEVEGEDPNQIRNRFGIESDHV